MARQVHEYNPSITKKKHIHPNKKSNLIYNSFSKKSGKCMDEKKFEQIFEFRFLIWNNVKIS